MEGYMKNKGQIINFLLMIFFGLCLAGCDTGQEMSQMSGGVQNPAPVIEEETADVENSILGVVKGIDSTKGSITI